MKKYIGIKPPTVSETGWRYGGNEGDIWTQNKNGKYTTTAIGKKDMVLTQEDMDADVVNGFLKEITE